MIELILSGFASCLEPYNFLLIFGGTALGIFVGSLPGLSSPMAIVVLLPLTYSLEALPALLSMLGVYVGTKLGGSFSAILLRTPGTPASACTALDGYPMAQSGRAGEALGYAVIGSTLGGFLSWTVAITCVPLLATIAVKSGNADIALVGVLGLVMVCSFIRASIVKGLIGSFLGLLIATIGMDPIDSTERFTFGHYELLTGVPFAAVLVGFFGFAVVLSDIGMIGQHADKISKKVNLNLPTFKDVYSRIHAVVIGSLYGVVVGAIPGVGAEASPWMAYGTVRNKSKTPEKFGTGIPEGILAPESSNNATTGGTMVPMLALGIPGDGSTAVMLGALILHGLQPGVTLMRDSGELVYGLLAGLLIATICMFLIAWRAIKWFVIMLDNDRGWLFPFILVLAVLGAFSAANDFFPVHIAIAAGVIGWILESAKFPVVTIVLGVILGPIIEQNVRVALALSSGNWGTFVSTWPRALIVVLIISLIGWEISQIIKRERVASPLKEINIKTETK